jgi:hypothetical protein
MKRTIQTILAVTFLSSFAWAENAQPMARKTCPYQRNSGILAATAAKKVIPGSPESSDKKTVVR